MTVSSTTARAQYNTNGTTGPWTIPFPFLADSHLKVVYTDANGVATTLALSSDYSCVGAGATLGGSLTTTTAYASGGTITILRDVPFDQQSDYVNGDQLPAATLEAGFDASVMRAQQLLEIAGRTLRVPSGEAALSELVSAVVRADRLLAFDTSGKPTISSFTLTQLASVITTALVGGAQTAAAITYLPPGIGALALALQDRIRYDAVAPEEWGAFGDGASHPLSATFATLAAAQARYPAAVALTDETDGVVIQSMLDAGVPVRGLPNKTYLTSRRIWVKTGAYLRGARRWAGAQSTDKTTSTSTIKYVGPTGANTVVVNLSTADVGILPTNNLQNVVCEDWIFDANDLAAMCTNEVRAWQGNQLDNLTAVGARVCHFNVTTSWVTSPRNRIVFKGRGAGAWFGNDYFGYGGTQTVDEVSLQDWFIYYAGCDVTTNNPYNVFTDTGGTHPTSANAHLECGIGIFNGRALKLTNCQVAQCSGPGIYMAPASTNGPTVVDGGYLEFNSRSSGASRTWATWNVTASASWGIVYRDIAFQGTAPAHRFTGVPVARIDQGPRFENCPKIGIVDADVGQHWGAFNSDQTVTVVGDDASVPLQSQGGFQSERGGPTFRYREGTFSPTLAGATAAGTGRTYSIQSASWERIGRMVTVRGQILLTAAGTGDTGGMAITNLPFTVQTGAGYNGSACTTNSSGLATAVVSLTGRAVAGTTRLDLYKRTAAATSETALVLADIGATTGFIFSITYPTSDA